jgi:peptidoglycan/LPS O-acetylase OafA/YrhL
MKKIPSLDGLRAISILMVILLHMLQHLDVSHKINRLWFLLGNGGTGVFVFFVISGFLITTLLLREHEKTGAISLRDFYLRRAFRILPPAYFYVAAIAALSWRWSLGVSLANSSSALLFYSNYFPRPWALNHFWSLSIEEQFYFLWPMTLLFVLRRYGRAAASWVAVAVILLCPLIRVLTFELGGAYLRHINGVSFQGRADALMFGCLVALSSGLRPFERVYRWAEPIWWVFPIVLFVVSGVIELRFGNYWDFPVGYTINGICASLLLIYCVRNPMSAAGKVLNWAPLCYIGVLSYSLYIWQQLFLNPENVQLFGSRLGAAFLPLSFLGLAAASGFSYYVVEKPSLRLRDRVERMLGWGKSSTGRAKAAS